MRKLFGLLILFLVSCALPSPEYETQDFIPREDILANSLYQDGVEMYRAGRFMDAELKLRQASFLFPQAENIRSNLALILKSNGNYVEANNIYLDLIKRYPEAYDYQFALADSYFREKRFKEASKYFEKAILNYEAFPDPTKAAQAARSLASLKFLEGDEPGALCGSMDALVYSPSSDQVIRHIKILLALGYYEQAHQNLLPLVANPSDVKDPVLLRLAALTFASIEKIDEAKKFVDLANESQAAGLKDTDAELLRISEVMAYKFPPEKKEGEEESEEEENAKAEEAKKNVIFNEQNLLYWPANMLELYQEYQAKILAEKVED